jgi:transcriptional regulator with XRE-family HTH domain
MSADKIAIGARLRAERTARGWDKPEMARQLADALTGARVSHDTLISYVKRWEPGKVSVSERYRLAYARAFGLDEEDLFGDDASARRTQDEPLNARAEVLPIPAIDEPSTLRLRRLSPDQADEMLEHLAQHWHVLVKADNLLGPRHALSSVCSQLGVLLALLRDLRPPLRRQALAVGAQYAESAAWLYEDAGEMAASYRWTGQAMEWALEADDHDMMAWTLFRRSQHAQAEGNAAQVIGLADAAEREQGGRPGPMLAAILQQRAQGLALDSVEVACHTAIDQALELAVVDHDAGARAGHGSFCSPAYLEMQRGRCWLMLGRPGKAVASFRTALDTLPSAYRRDRGVAYAGLAAALVAENEVEQAAHAAMDGLMIAADSGSSRILGMVDTVAAELAPHARIEPVAQLLAELAEVRV